MEIKFDLEAYRRYDSLSWIDHWIYRLDGKGDRMPQPARYRFLPPHNGIMVYPWGLAEMDNGEIAVAGVAGTMVGLSGHQTVVGFTSDRGATWSEYCEIPDCTSRPMMLT